MKKKNRVPILFLGVWLIIGGWWFTSVVLVSDREDLQETMYELEAVEAARPMLNGDEEEFDNVESMGGSIEENGHYQITWLDTVIHYSKELTTTVVGIANVIFLIRRRKYGKSQSNSIS